MVLRSHVKDSLRIAPHICRICWVRIVVFINSQNPERSARASEKEEGGKSDWGLAKAAKEDGRRS